MYQFWILWCVPAAWLVSPESVVLIWIKVMRDAWTDSKYMPNGKESVSLPSHICLSCFWSVWLICAFDFQNFDTTMHVYAERKLISFFFSFSVCFGQECNLCVCVCAPIYGCVVQFVVSEGEQLLLPELLAISLTLWISPPFEVTFLFPPWRDKHESDLIDNARARLLSCRNNNQDFFLLVWWWEGGNFPPVVFLFIHAVTQVFAGKPPDLCPQVVVGESSSASSCLNPERPEFTSRLHYTWVTPCLQAASSLPGDFTSLPTVFPTFSHLCSTFRPHLLQLGKRPDKAPGNPRVTPPHPIPLTMLFILLTQLISAS